MDAWRAIEKSTDVWLPVRLVDEIDLVSGETGKTAGDVTVQVAAAGAAAVAATIATGDWVEVGDGDYWLRIGADEFAAYGLHLVTVACAGCGTYRALVEVGLDLSTAAAGKSTNFYGQARRVHALVGGTVIVHDPAAPATRTYRDEADAADLLTRTQTVAADNTSKITAS